MPIPLSLRFASTYRFVNQAEYDRLTAADSGWVARQFGEYEVFAVSGETSGLIHCNGVGIWGENGVGIGHFLPKVHEQSLPVQNTASLDRAELPEVAQQTQATMDYLGEKSGLRAFLAGGMRHVIRSHEYARFLYRLLHQSGVPTTSLWGQSDFGMLQMHHHVTQDVWSLNCMELGHRGSKQPMTLDALKQRFALIQMAPGDRLELGKRVYTDLSFNTDILA